MNRQKDLGAEIVPIGGGNANAAGLGGMVHHMNHQAHEAIHEIFPRTGPSLKAAFEQIAVDFGKSHADDPLAKGENER